MNHPELHLQDVEHIDILGATLRLNPTKHKFTVVTHPGGDDVKPVLQGFRTEGEVGLLHLLLVLMDMCPRGKRPSFRPTTCSIPLLHHGGD